MTREQMRRLLGVRGPMNDMRLFVGRQIELRMLDGVAHPPNNCAWLFGAPRNGKSSLARHVAKKAEDAGKKVVHVNAMDIPGSDFDGLLKKTIFGDDSGQKIGDVRAAFTRMASETSRRPLLIVFDNFDSHALNLRFDEQAFLRSKKETYPALNYLFITRRDPTLIVEDLADEGSRLLGICKPIRVPILSIGEVKQLCKLVADSFDLDCHREWTDQILEMVGGNPLAVTDILYSTVSSLGEADTETAQASLSFDSTSLKGILSRHWSGLPAACQLFLLGHASEMGKDTARLEGYWNNPRGEAVRPWLLREIANSSNAVESRERSLSLMDNFYRLLGTVEFFMMQSGQLPINWIPSMREHYSQVSRHIDNVGEFYFAAHFIYKQLERSVLLVRSSPADFRAEPFVRFIESDVIKAIGHLSKEKELSSIDQRFLSRLFENACGVSLGESPEDFRRSVDYVLIEVCRHLETIAELFRLRLPQNQ